MYTTGMSYLGNINGIIDNHMNSLQSSEAIQLLLRKCLIKQLDGTI